MIDLRYVKKLIELVDDSTVDSIEISTDKGMKIRIAKSPATQRGAVQMVAPAPVAAAALAPEPRTSPAQGIPVVATPVEVPAVAPGLE